jgi:urease accessory protein
LRNDLCVARIIAEDGLALRNMLLPILDDLTRNSMPKTWRL